MILLKKISKFLFALILVLAFSFTGMPDAFVNKAEAACDFIRPAEGTITSGFRTPSRPNHHGLDIAKAGIVPIKAAAAGTVSRSYYSTSYGHVVFIKHNIRGVQYETVYAHMRGRNVSEGQYVAQGTVLGNMGATGDATGQHLHYEIHRPSWNINKTYALNPANYINCSGGGGGGTTHTQDFATTPWTSLSKTFYVAPGGSISVKPSGLSQSPYNIRIRLTNVNTGAYTEETVPSQDGVFVNMRGGTYRVTLYQQNSGNVSGKVTVKTATETHTSNFSIVNQYTLSKTFSVPVGGKISVTPSNLNRSPYKIRVRLTNVNTGAYTEETLPTQDGLFVNMRGGTYRVTLYQLNPGNLSGKVTVKVY